HDPGPASPGTYDGGSRVTTQLVFAPALPGDQPRIGDLLVAGRGDTIHGSEQYSHVTAHIAVERAVAATVRGRTVPEALQSLVALARRLPAMPTYPVRADWEIGRGGQPAAGSSTGLPGVTDQEPFDRRQVLGHALHALELAVAAADHAVRAGLGADPAESEFVLQRLAAAYLAARNALPLVSVDTAAPAGGNAEGQHRADLDRMEEALDNEQRVQAGSAMGALRNLLDVNALLQAGNSEDLGSVARYPVPEPAAQTPRPAANLLGRPQRAAKARAQE